VDRLHGGGPRGSAETRLRRAEERSSRLGAHRPRDGAARIAEHEEDALPALHRRYRAHDERRFRTETDRALRNLREESFGTDAALRTQLDGL
jgi:hypothetical protein